MRLLSIFLASMILVCAVSAAAEDMNGFRDFTWGSNMEVILESDPMLVEGHMGVMPGVKAYQRRDEDLNYGGIKADGITYIFFKGRFTSVSIDFKGFDNYEKLLAYCSKRFGPVTATAVMRQEQYAGFDTPKTGVMLLYQLSMQTANYGRLYLYSKKFLN
ncbi:MAG: hypothetical protein JJE30_19335 [Desulfuromonadales bacterium]|nr:hypothetical protein [Desulfuromonadales bacterium]